MNVFELSIVASPIAGLVAGICTVPTSAPLSKASGAAVGTLVGLVLNVVTRRLVSTIAGATGLKEQSNLTWRTFVRPLIVLLPMVTPLATLGVSVVFVRALFS